MDQLISEIETFRATHDMSEAAFGKKALNDARLVKQLKAGRDMRWGTIERIRNFMLTYKPERQAA